MTDNDIIKALECCYKDGRCEGCPLIGDRYCESTLPKAVLDLINRLQKDKEYYKNNRNEYQDKVMFISKQCDGLQEEINRQKAEIERLEEDNFIKSQKRANIFEITNAYERGRAEAITEFAERLKEKKWSAHTTFGMRDFVEVIIIDQIAEEMKGEQ